MKNKQAYHNLSKVFYLGNGGTISVLSVIFSLLMSCQSKPTAETPTTEAPSDEISLSVAQIEAFGISTGTFSTQTLQESISVNGSIEAQPQQKASVSFPIEGYIKQIHVVSGSLVSKGQALASIESLPLIQWQQDYLQAKHTFIFETLELQRQRTLNAEDAGAKRKLQEAENRFASTQTLLNALKTKLLMVGINPETLKDENLRATASVVSPIAGHVQGILVNIGKATQAQDVLFEVANSQNPTVKLRVFEKDAPKIQMGQTFTAVVAGKNYSGKISTIGRSFRPDDRSIEVSGQFNPVPQSLFVGQYISAQIQTNSHNATVLPETATVREGEAVAVFVEKAKGKYQKISVKTGIEQHGFVEILNPPTQPIVLKGARLLLAEMTKGVEGDE